MSPKLKTVSVKGIALALCLISLEVSASLATDASLTLWYQQPAKKWTEALPLGNGRLGAMVFGSVPGERLQLNEESLWAGEPLDIYPDNFLHHFSGFQQLVRDGKIEEVHKFGLKNLTQSPASFRSYEPLVDLMIEIPGAKIRLTRKKDTTVTAEGKDRLKMDGQHTVYEKTVAGKHYTVD